MRLLEPALLSLSLAVWLVALLAMLGPIPLAGALSLSLYHLYGLAAVLGWLSGNVYVGRTRNLPRPIRRRLVVVFWLGPPSLLFLLRAMAPVASQDAAPMAPVYAFGVFSVLFLVPVSLKGAFSER